MKVVIIEEIGEEPLEEEVIEVEEETQLQSLHVKFVVRLVIQLLSVTTEPKLHGQSTRFRVITCKSELKRTLFSLYCNI